VRGVAWLGVILALATPAAAATLTPEQYAHTLSQVATQLDRVAKSGDAKRAAAEALRELPTKAEMRRDAQSPAVAVDNRTLLADLRRQVAAGPRGIRTAAGIVGSLAEAVGAPAPPPPASVRATLKRVLARREFQPQWWESYAKTINQWIADVLLWLLSRIHIPNLDISGRVWRAVGFGLLVAIGAVIVYLIAALVTRALPRSRPAPDLPAARPLVIRPYSAWLAEAEQRLQAGDYRGAVRAIHMAALMKLDDAGLVRYDNALTDGRFVRALQSKGQRDAAGALANLNRVFALVWYGRRAAGAEEYSTARTLLTELEGAATP
jgi:hypothetical protein